MAAELSFPWYNPVKLYVLYDDKSFILLDTFFFSVELMDRPGVVQEAVKCRVLRLFFLIPLSLPPSLPPRNAWENSPTLMHNPITDELFPRDSFS